MWGRRSTFSAPYLLSSVPAKPPPASSRHWRRRFTGGLISSSAHGGRSDSWVLVYLPASSLALSIAALTPFAREARAIAERGLRDPPRGLRRRSTCPSSWPSIASGRRRERSSVPSERRGVRISLVIGIITLLPLIVLSAVRASPVNRCCRIEARVVYSVTRSSLGGG